MSLEVYEFTNRYFFLEIVTLRIRLNDQVGRAIEGSGVFFRMLKMAIRTK